MKNKILTFFLAIVLTVIAMLLALSGYRLYDFSIKAKSFGTRNHTINRLVTVPEQLSLVSGNSASVAVIAISETNRLMSNFAYTWELEDTSFCRVDATGRIYTTDRAGRSFGQGYGRTSLKVSTASGIASNVIPVTVSPADMVYVPEGYFIRGGDEGTPANEKPQRNIYLDGYYIAINEVTNGSYAKFLNSGGAEYFNSGMEISFKDGIYRSFPGRENHPVRFVSWLGANAYAEWRGRRLPTEAEWEKAARGSLDSRTFPTGETLAANSANYRKSGDPFEPATSPAGFYNGSVFDGYITVNSPAPFGNYDMAGNVSEWTSDWYNIKYFRTSPEANPTGPESGIEKVIKGGSWFDIPNRLRTSYRTSGRPDLASEFIGFRCALTLK